MSIKRSSYDEEDLSRISKDSKDLINEDVVGDSLYSKGFGFILSSGDFGFGLYPIYSKDLASKDFQDGKLNRNPAILAKRFLTELPNIKEKYALPDFPGFDVVEKACKYYAGNEKRIHF